jgi:hypothetical protein
MENEPTLTMERPDQLVRHAFTDLIEALELRGPRFDHVVRPLLKLKYETIRLEDLEA